MLQTEVFDPRFTALVDVQQNPVVLTDSCIFSEGPIWNPAEQSFLCSDTRLGGRMYRWSAESGFQTVRSYTNAANGQAFDAKGRVLLCEHFAHRVARMQQDGTGYEVLASHYDGRELNSPNDVIVKNSDGMIYFTDPHFGRRQGGCGIASAMPQPVQGVYRIDPDTREITLMTGDAPAPNGLAFSPDEKKFYVADTEMLEIVAFDVDAEGNFYNRRSFPKTRSFGHGCGVPDGMCVDTEGNIYLAAQGGVHVFTGEGDYLGIIGMPKTVGNLCFGGDDYKTLFICCSNLVLTIRGQVAGAKVGMI